MLKPKSIEEACQLVKLSQHLDSSIYGVKHQEHNPYTEREREPVCQAVKTPREYGQHNHLDSQLASMMDKMVSMQEATEKSLQELHHQVHELKKQTPQSNQNSRPGTFQCYSCGGRGHIARHCKKSAEQAQWQGGNHDDKKTVKPARVGETGISPTRKEKSRPILTENNSELKSSDNVAKDTSQEKENVETIEKKLQDALPGVKIVTVKRTAETEFEKLGKNKTNKKKRKKKNKDATPTQECLPDMGEQPLLKVGTFDESSIIVESTPPGQQVKVSETNQELVTNQDKEVVPEKNLSQENNYDPQISESDVNDGCQGGTSNESIVGGIDRTFTILKTGTASMLRIPVVCNRRPMAAVIDSAAEVTILSDKIYNSLQDRPQILRKTVMYAAGKGMQMDTIIVGPVKLEVGSKSYCTDVYVAPIDDDMLLGLDFLKRHQTITDLKNNTFTIGDDQIPLYCGPQSEIPIVAKVTVPKRTVVPPHSVVRIPGQLDVDLSSFIVESSPQCQGPLLVPRCFFQDSKPTLCVFNPTESPYTLRKNAVIAQAYEAKELTSVQEVKLQNTEGDDFDAKIDKMVSQAEYNLTSSQLSRLKELLKQNDRVFSKNDLDIGEFKEVEHSIDTGSAEPIRQRLRRTPITFAEEEEKLLGKMLDAKLIEPSVSEWASPPVLIRKRDGTVRYAIDYRKVNSVTKKEVYPLPLIDECIDSLAGNKWFSKLDANSAYYQVKMKEEDKQKTAFITKYGLFQFTRMSFGLCNAPATYARAMQLVLRGLTWDIVLAFLDDILVMGKDFESHMENLEKVFERFRQYGIKLKPVKCEFCTKETTFLGRQVNGEGLTIGENYVQTIKE